MLQLLKYFRKSDPWIESPPAFKDDYVIEPSSLSADKLEDELFKLYLETRFQPRYAFWLIVLILTSLYAEAKACAYRNLISVVIESNLAFSL